MSSQIIALKLPNSDEGGIELLAAFCGLTDRLEITQLPAGSKPAVEGPHGSTFDGVNTVSKLLARESPLAEQLLGTGAEQALVEEWLTLRHTQLVPITEAGLQHVHDHLAGRVFLVGKAITLADFATFAALHEAVVNFPSAQRNQFVNIVRWYDYVQHATGAARFFPPLEVQRVSGVAARLEVLEAVAKAEKVKQEAAAAKAKAAARAAAPSTVPAPGKSREAALSGPSAVSSTGPAIGVKEAVTAGVNKVKQGVASAAAAVGLKQPAAADSQESAESAESAAPQQKGKKEKKEKREKAPAAAPASTEEPTVAALDLRVGRIVEVGPHPNAESLYLEKIDVGEAEPRQIISGLVKFVPLAEMQDRMVVCLLNLKPAKMRDVISYGMVMCASNAAHDVVEPLAVPSGSTVGERITFEGFEGEPEAQLNPKKKILEKISPSLLVSDEGLACYKGVPFQTAAGPITSRIKGGTIS